MWISQSKTISTASTLGDKAIGDIVKLNVGGVAIDFIVIQQGNPDTNLYDRSCDGTWLLMKDIYESRVWHSSAVNNYTNSTIHSYLNGTFLGLFDSNIQSIIKQVKIPYVNGTGSSGSVASGSNGLDTRIFLLAAYELGWTQATNSYLPIDGSCLSYFSNTATTDSKRIAYYNGTATYWWTRSPSIGNAINATFVNTAGNFNWNECNISQGIRPALILPSTLAVEEDGTVMSTEAPTEETTIQVAKEVKKAWIGNSNGIAKLFYSGGLALSELPVGSLVSMNVGGVAKNFMVVHQGLPSSLYDSSCDGTWLLMKDVYESRQWHSSNSNSYKASTIHTYLNGTFLNLFDADIKAQIKTVKIPYVNGTSSSAVASGSSGLSAQIFLLSGYEVGFTTSVNSNFPVDGAKLDYFESGDTSGSTNRTKRIAYLNGTAAYWWLRSPYTSTIYSALRVRANGSSSYVNCSDSYGVRPALILPNNAVVNPTPNADGSYTLLA